MYSENLKKLRFELRLSAQKLADELSVSISSVQQYERGTREPNYNFLYKLNTVLNVNINWLMTGKGNMFNPPDFEQVQDELTQKMELMINEALKRRGL